MHIQSCKNTSLVVFVHLKMVFLFKKTMRAKIERIRKVTPAMAQAITVFISMVSFWNTSNYVSLGLQNMSWSGLGGDYGYWININIPIYILNH